MSLWQQLGKKLPAKALKVIHRSQFNTVNSLILFLLGAFLSVALAACFGGNVSNSTIQTPTARPIADNKDNIELTLVSFAVTKAAHQAIIPKFVEKWKQEHHQTVTFKQSYGGSGSQTRAVLDGLEADVIHLARTGDIETIEKAGLIQPGWEKEVPHDGIVTKSVVALVTRSGNPKGINNWEDLSKNDITVITADPKTSGVASWNFLALWNAVIKTGGDDAQATELVTKVYKNAPLLTKDAREATYAFYQQSQGDALINYENEIILAEQKGEHLTPIVPNINISIDNAIAVVDKNVDQHGTRAVAEAFVKYLYTKEAQQEFAKLGFRPVDETVVKTQEVAAKFPQVKTLTTVKDFGGWDAINQKFFADGAIFDQIQAKINSWRR